MMKLPRPERLPLAAVLVAALLVGSGCGNRPDPKVQEGYDLVVANKVDEAVALANALLVDDPDNAPALNLLGLALYKAGDVEGSIVQYGKALKIDEDFAEARFNLGNSFEMLERTDEAEVEFRKAIRARKDFVLAHYNLAVIYDKTDRKDEAEKEYRLAVDHDPQFFFGYVGLGNLAFGKGDFEGAIVNLSRALELSPTAKELRVLLGNAYMQSGRTDGFQLAENEYRAAAGIDPEYLDAVYSVGVALHAQNLIPEAVEQFARARDLAALDPAQAGMVDLIDRFFEQYGKPPAAGQEAGQG